MPTLGHCPTSYKKFLERDATIEMVFQLIVSKSGH